MSIWDTAKGAAGSVWNAGNKFFATPIGQGVASFAGQQLTNTANAKQAREQMDFQAGQAQQQMGFQERMSNTAVQRHVQDLRAAGLNPALAFSSQGASSPAGSGVGAGAQAQMADSVAAGISSAREERRQRQELKLLESQRDKTAYESQKEGWNAQTAAQQYFITQETKDDQVNAIRANLATARQAADESKARTDMYNAQAANAKQDNMLRAFEIPRLRAESEMYDSLVGGLLPWIGSARNATSLFRGIPSR